MHHDRHAFGITSSCPVVVVVDIVSLLYLVCINHSIANPALDTVDGVLFLCSVILCSNLMFVPCLWGWIFVQFELHISYGHASARRLYSPYFYA